MNSLFIASEDVLEVQVSPEALMLLPIQKIIKRDRGSKGDAQGRNKSQAKRELTYVYHMCDWQSTYASYPEEQRKQVLGNNIFGDDEYTPDELVQECMVWYSEVTENTAVRLLQSSRKALHSLQQYFETIDITTEEDKGKASKDLIAALSKMAPMMESLILLEKNARASKQVHATRKQVTLDKYNQ